MKQTNSMKSLVAAMTIAASTCAGIALANAQDAFPSEPVQLVVPWGRAGLATPMAG